MILTKLSEQGTFKLVSITKTTGRVMMFMLGERNDCIAWYVTKSESWAVLLRGGGVGLLQSLCCCLGLRPA